MTDAPSAVSDTDLLRGYVDVWWQAINDFTDLLEELDEAEWATPRSASPTTSPA
ncbi:MAG: hypothetical protein HYU55_13195 [Nocardioides sp.]|nr:hypothetical protein [Nocardioides sp.]